MWRHIFSLEAALCSPTRFLELAHEWHALAYGIRMRRNKASVGR